MIKHSTIYIDFILSITIIVSKAFSKEPPEACKLNNPFIISYQTFPENVSVICLMPFIEVIRAFPKLKINKNESHCHDLNNNIRI